MRTHYLKIFIGVALVTSAAEAQVRLLRSDSPKGQGEEEDVLDPHESIPTPELEELIRWHEGEIDVSKAKKGGNFMKPKPVPKRADAKYKEEHPEEARFRYTPDYSVPGVVKDWLGSGSGKKGSKLRGVRGKRRDEDESESTITAKKGTGNVEAQILTVNAIDSLSNSTIDVLNKKKEDEP